MEKSNPIFEYERRAASFLDTECRVMVDWFLLEHLKRMENQGKKD